jgi:5'-methylthioadenosine phosphorylase
VLSIPFGIRPSRRAASDYENRSHRSASGGWHALPIGRLGIITGSGLHGERGERVGRGDLRSARGVVLHDDGAVVTLARHGPAGATLPHAIDHGANVLALREAGVDRVLAIASTGSLRLDWPVGTVVCPDDFYAPQVTVSIHDDGRAFGVRGFDATWRRLVLDTWRERAARPIVDGGVYAQTHGPRFETPAEVRALAQVADLVGMTVAAECIVAAEAGLAYAAVCVVDNLGNGLALEPLDLDSFRAAVEANRAALLNDLEAVAPALASTRA